MMQKIESNDFTQYYYPSMGTLSPDQKQVAYVLTRAKEEENCYQSDLWVCALDTKESRPLTAWHTEKSFLWLDNNTILFPSMQDEGCQSQKKAGEDWTIYYAADTRSGETSTPCAGKKWEQFRLPYTAKRIDQTATGGFLVMIDYDYSKPNLIGLEGAEKEAALSAIGKNKDYEVFDELPFWFNGKGIINKKRNRLFSCDAQGGSLTPISPDYAEVEFYQISGNQVLFIANTYTDKKEQTNALFSYDLESKCLTTLVPAGLYSMEYATFLQDKLLFLGSDRKHYGDNENPGFFTIEEGKIKLLLHYDASTHNSIVTDCKQGEGETFAVVDDQLYFLSTIEDYVSLNRYTFGKEVETIFSEAAIDSFAVGASSIVYIGTKKNSLQELYQRKEGVSLPLTSFNQGILTARSRGEIEQFSFENDGVRLEGYVVKPINFDPGKRYPGILTMHGGPKVTFGQVYHHEIQMLANAGYFVFYTNPRGSDGRGNAFADILGKHGSIDYSDFMKLTDEVCARYPNLDGDRLGVTGGSYGGFMTNWIIGHTDRFHAAVSQRGIANWLSKSMTTDIGYSFNTSQLKADPWSSPEKMWFHSPMKYADQVKTPTLFIHSDEDYRCWLSEALQMFTSLKYHGVDSRVCLFHGENHGLSRVGKPQHRMRRLDEMLNWFNKYLK